MFQTTNQIMSFHLYLYIDTAVSMDRVTFLHRLVALLGHSCTFLRGQGGPGGHNARDVHSCNESDSLSLVELYDNIYIYVYINIYIYVYISLNVNSSNIQLTQLG
jgi:hypothetical protein